MTDSVPTLLADDPPDDVPRARRGHDGVPIYSGWSDIEANPRLSPRAWFGTWGRPGILDEMVRG